MKAWMACRDLKYLNQWQPFFSPEVSCRTFSHMLGLISSSSYCARNKNDSCFPSRGIVSSAKTFRRLSSEMYVTWICGTGNYKKTITKRCTPLAWRGERWRVSWDTTQLNPNAVTQSSSLFMSGKHGYHRPRWGWTRFNWTFTPKEQKVQQSHLSSCGTIWTGS